MLIMSFLQSCTTVQEVYEAGEDGYSKTFFADFDTTWQAVRTALGRKYPIENENRESGIIKTKWFDNTQEKNFTDSFGAGDTLKSARMKFTITVAKGFSEGKNAVKVAVYKQQEVQRDFLEGWSTNETDGIDERALLYRVSRLILIKAKLDFIQQKKSDNLKLPQ